MKPAVRQLLIGGRQPFLDDLQRANTSDGTIGNGWDLRGPYAGSYPLPASSFGRIQSNRFVADATQIVYAMRDMGQIQSHLKARFRLATGGGVSNSTCALLISPNNKLIDTIMHVVITRFEAKIQKRINGGAFVDLATTGAIVLPLDTTITVQLDVLDNKAYLSVNSNRITAVDDDIRQCLGNFIAFEIFQSPASLANFVQFEYMETGVAKRPPF